MDITDMKPADAVKLTRERYYSSLTLLHHIVKVGNSPTLAHMEMLEKYRQEVDIAEDMMLRSLGLAPDEDQLDLLDGVR